MAGVMAGPPPAQELRARGPAPLPAHLPLEPSGAASSRRGGALRIFPKTLADCTVRSPLP